MKVVLHLREVSQWPVALANAHNLLEIVPQATIEFVINGPGVLYLFSLSLEQAVPLEELRERGVVFSACNNAIKANQLDAKQLPAVARIVPAAIHRLVETQQQGYAYVKP